MTISPKVIYRFNAITIKLLMVCFFRTRTKILKLYMQKQSWERKRNVRSKLLDLRPYYKATITKRVWCWCRNRNICQWNRIENSEINPHTYGQLIYEKEGTLYNGGKALSSINCNGKTGVTCQRIKLDHSLTPYTKISSKWIRHKCKAGHHKTLREKHRQNTPT